MDNKRYDQELSNFIIKFYKSIAELKNDFDNLSESNRKQFEEAAMSFLKVHSYKVTIEDICNWLFR